MTFRHLVSKAFQIFFLFDKWKVKQLYMKLLHVFWKTLYISWTSSLIFADAFRSQTLKSLISLVCWWICTIRVQAEHFTCEFHDKKPLELISQCDLSIKPLAIWLPDPLDFLVLRYVFCNAFQIGDFIRNVPSSNN